MTIENVGFPLREPMLVAGKVDAITGFSFSSFLNLKSNGVPAEDIRVFLMSDYGLDLYGNAIMVNPEFAAENPAAVAGFVARHHQGLAGHRGRSGGRREVRAGAQPGGARAGRVGTPGNEYCRQRQHRLRCRSTGSAASTWRGWPPRSSRSR